MCGIVGYIGHRNASSILTEGLKRLEYRGYDSAGIATLQSGDLHISRAVGKLANLEAELDARPITGTLGIGHTRWATHGPATIENAHPHATQALAVVHNGIIENHAELRQNLREQGYGFSSQTDTEVITLLIQSYLDGGAEPLSALKRSLDRLEGAYAIAVSFADDPDHLFAARKGSPLAIGHGTGETYLGSDAIALAPHTRQITYLDEGDMAILGRDGLLTFDENFHPVEREQILVDIDTCAADKGGYQHYMRKEISEQPDAITRTLDHYLGEGLPDIDFSAFDRIVMVACGTAYYACLTARYWFEREAGLPVDLDVASEFRYREPPVGPRTLAILVSQSGETADTLAALRYLAPRATTVALVSTTTSTIARESDIILPTLAGPEIGVASTKAFTCQLAALACLALKAARSRDLIDERGFTERVQDLRALPNLIQGVIAQENHIAQIAQDIAPASSALFLGRGDMHPIALEGALKLKEISYIHAEGYPAGELKHGPIALVDETLPVISLLPGDALLEKTQSNVEEVMARGGRVVPIGENARENGVTMPAVHGLAAPILYAVPLQLLSYHAALARGTDVDQPRNLAKSVTVE